MPCVSPYSSHARGLGHYATVTSHHGAQVGAGSLWYQELRTMQQPQCRNEGELKAIDNCAMQRNRGNLIFLKNRAQRSHVWDIFLDERMLIQLDLQQRAQIGSQVKPKLFGWMDFPKKAQNPTWMDVDSSFPSGSATLFLERLGEWEKFIKTIDNEVILDIFKHQKWGKNIVQIARFPHLVKRV